MDLVCIVIFEFEYSIAFGENPALTSCSVTQVIRCPPRLLSVTDLEPSPRSGSCLDVEGIQPRAATLLIPNFEQR
jgi:hypothetical protein